MTIEDKMRDALEESLKRWWKERDKMPTPEERALACVTFDQEKDDWDSWPMPLDIQKRIARQITEAVEVERKPSGRDKCPECDRLREELRWERENSKALIEIQRLRGDEWKQEAHRWRDELTKCQNQHSNHSDEAKLKRALLMAIPWIGHVDPPFATADAKAKNKQAMDEAFEAATACFPEAPDGHVIDYSPNNVEGTVMEKINVQDHGVLLANDGATNSSNIEKLLNSKGKRLFFPSGDYAFQSHHRRNQWHVTPGGTVTTRESVELYPQAEMRDQEQR